MAAVLRAREDELELLRGQVQAADEQCRLLTLQLHGNKGRMDTDFRVAVFGVASRVWC